MGDIEVHRAASQAYIEEAANLRELTDRAAELFKGQPSAEKRKLMDYVVSGCRWQGGELVPEYRKPFDMLAGTAVTARETHPNLGQEPIAMIRVERLPVASRATPEMSGLGWTGCAPMTAASDDAQGKSVVMQSERSEE
jgi:hypothetical protein